MNVAPGGYCFGSSSNFRVNLFINEENREEPFFDGGLSVDKGITMLVQQYMPDKPSPTNAEVQSMVQSFAGAYAIIDVALPKFSEG